MCQKASGSPVINTLGTWRFLIDGSQWACQYLSTSISYRQRSLSGCDTDLWDWAVTLADPWPLGSMVLWPGRTALLIHTLTIFNVFQQPHKSKRASTQMTDYHWRTVWRIPLVKFHTFWAVILGFYSLSQTVYPYLCSSFFIRVYTTVCNGKKSNTLV